MIERQLELVELARSPAREPDPSAVNAEVARMAAVAGQRWSKVLEDAGLDERHVEQLARDTMRIQMYLDDRFPPAPVSDAEARRYYEANPQAFMRDGMLIPFVDAEVDARAAVAQSMRRTRIARWLDTLRNRVEIVIPGGGR
jgi:hypothetical protein